MTRCHFVYSVPGYKSNNSLTRLVHKSRRVMFNKGITRSILLNRKPSLDELNHWPVRSPYENTKHIYNALSQYVPTNLYHCSERNKIAFKSDDIFLGHPYFPYTGVEVGVTENAHSARTRPKIRALISPLHCNTSLQSEHLNGLYLHHVNSLLKSADILFGIMGEYWWKEWDNSKYASWKTKMVRLDMAVNVNNYPVIKRKFNRSGERKFLYIGNNNPNKNTEMLSDLAKNMKPGSFGWIGSGANIPYVHRISSDVTLTPDFMKKIAVEYDFFISTSIADANPTTILEAMAWGFPVVCTPQSGYYKTDYLFNIEMEDHFQSIEQLNNLQSMHSDQLVEIAKTAREVVEERYNWENFTNKIVSKLGLSK